MDRVFQKIADDNFSALKGTAIDASVPIPQHLINEMIAAGLRGNNNIESCQVKLHGGNRVSADLKTAWFPLTLKLKLKLDKSVDFASYASPKLRAWLENNRLLGSLGSMFNVLPEGIKLYGNQIVLDLGAFLPTPQQKRILDLVKSVDIQTEEGKVILDMRIEVD